MVGGILYISEISFLKVELDIGSLNSSRYFLDIEFYRAKHVFLFVVIVIWFVCSFVVSFLRLSENNYVQNVKCHPSNYLSDPCFMWLLCWCNSIGGLILQYLCLCLAPISNCHVGQMIWVASGWVICCSTPLYKITKEEKWKKYYVVSQYDIHFLFYVTDWVEENDQSFSSQYYIDHWYNRNPNSHSPCSCPSKL